MAEEDSSWSANNHALVWALINKIQEAKNYAVLFGKKDKNENTRGESKTAVFQRIAKELFPQLYGVDPKKAGNRVKTKVDE